MNLRFVRLVLASSLIALTGANAATPAQSQGEPASQQDQAAQAGIRATIGDYFKAHATGDPSYLRRAFLPTARIEGIRDGRLISRTLDEYSTAFRGTPASDESTRVRTIDFIDVSGPAATAKATLVHGATVFTDYIILLKLGEEWKIANKVYSARPKDGPAG